MIAIAAALASHGGDRYPLHTQLISAPNFQSRFAEGSENPQPAGRPTPQRRLQILSVLRWNVTSTPAAPRNVLEDPSLENTFFVVYLLKKLLNRKTLLEIQPISALKSAPPSRELVRTN